MKVDTLEAISPVDGRYLSKTEALSGFYSEAALIKYRIQVEVEYFIALCELPLPQLVDFDKNHFVELRKLYLEFDLESARRIKEIEGITNHDVKAVEYLIKEHFDRLNLEKFKEFIHFGLTSQDINNTALPLMVREAHSQVMIKELNSVVTLILQRAEEWKDISMLARTHGQPASPTRLGKEFFVFVERIQKQADYFIQIPPSAKFGGATGNFNAHHVAYPEIDWVEFANNFVNNILGLDRSQTTTQIEHYDNLAAYFDCWRRINTVLIDFCRDIWTYISMEYFGQKIKAGEVGSSAMPHKVNPIDFENAEGNLGIANALLEHLSGKLPISRLQRDLTDSTVMRATGLPMAHTLIALKSIEKGLDKLLLHEDKLAADLEMNWAVVAEAIQTVLRREGYPKPYEALKALTRKDEKITAKTISDFIDILEVNDSIKKELKAITPHNFTGI